MSTSSTSDSTPAGRPAEDARDLGFGVKVQRRGEEVRVFSRLLELPWNSAGPGLPGTAVLFEEELWEAHLLESGGPGELWRLLPWQDSEVLRHTEELSANSVALLSREKEQQKRHEDLGFALLILMPFVGFLPAALQDRIEVEWGLRAWKSTLLSSLPELLGAPLAVGLVFGDWRPPIPNALAILLCFYLFFEGMYRMNYSFTLHRPMGSILTSPLGLILRRRNRVERKRRKRKSGPPLFGLIFRYIFLGFAPAGLQEKLVEAMGLPPRQLSIMTATAEMVGGFLDFSGNAQDPFVLLSLFFFLEGGGRLLLGWMRGRAVGSLLGFPLMPLYRRWSRQLEADGPAEEEG